jgi:hypothetical protein
MKPPNPTEFDSSGPTLPPGCIEARESLQNRLDGDERSESESVREHRARCIECRALERAARLLLGVLPNLSMVQPAGHFADRVMARALAEPYRPWIKKRWTWVGGLTLAASVLIGVLLLIREDRKTFEPLRLVVAVPSSSTIDPPAKNAVSEKPVPLRDSLQEASSAVAALARNSSADSFGLKLPKWSMANTKVDPIGNLEPLPASLQDVRHNASMGIAPITDSAKRAFNVLWRELGPDMDKTPVNN